MKRLEVITLALLMLVGVSAFAQPGQGRMLRGDNNRGNQRFERFECNIPNLTDEQQAKITDLRVKHLKETTPLRNEQRERMARLRTLETADKVDLTAVNKTIDEISAIRTQVLKKNAAHRVEVASLLTDEQKVFVNARRGNRMNNGFRRGNGRGNYRGMNSPRGGYWSNSVDDE